MNRNNKLYIRKVFFISKLVLALVFLLVVVKTVLLPEYIEKTLSSVSASDRDGVRINETEKAQDLSYEDYAEIVEKNPFGITNQKTSINRRISAESVVSDGIGLALLGTVSGSPEIARAIIKNLNTGVINLYRIGQTVEGTFIEDIGIDEIIVMHNGKRKVLKLSICQSSSNNTVVMPLSKTINRVSSAVKDDSLTHKDNTEAKTETGYIEAILNEAVIEPHFVDGHVEGLRITNIENIEEAKYLDIRNGDIIRAVNGNLLTSKQKAFQVFKKATSQAVISLELLRNEETKKFSFDLR